MIRWLATLILGLGTTLLIVHASIPHHHHEEVVCFHHGGEHGHGQETTHHNGPANPYDFNCVLKQFYLLSSGQKVMGPHALRLCWSYPASFLLAVSEGVDLSPESVPIKLRSHFSPRKYPSPAIPSTGPRAPPLA